MRPKARPLLVLFVTIFLDLVGFGIVIPILPLYAEELGASGFEIGLVAGIFSLMQFLFAPFWGRLSDHYGRRPILLISIFLTGLSYLLFAQAHSLSLLLLARALAGIGSANISAANAFISDISSPDKRAQNFGIVGAAFGLGFIFGPPLGGWLKNDFGLQWVGYVAAGLSFFNFLMALVLLPESLRQKSALQKILPNPFKDLWLIARNAELRGLFLSGFIFVAAFSMMHVTASLLWESEFGLNEAEIGYVFAFIGLTVALVQGTLIGHFKRWFGEKRLYISGSLLMGVGLLAMPYVPPALFIPLELLALLLLSVGNGFFSPTLASLISQRAPAHEQGKMMGILQSTSALSRVVGPLLGGSLYAIGPALPYWAAFVLMLITALLAWQVVRRRLSPEESKA